MNVLFVNVKRPLGTVDFVKKGVSLNNSIVAPLDLAYPAALLREHGIKVKIIDANTERLSDDIVLKRAEEFNPEIIVLNTTQMDRWQCAFLTITEVVSISEKLKKKIGAKIMVIGPHNSVTPKWTLSKSTSFDYAVRDEPDFTILELAQRIKKGKSTDAVKGIAFVKNGKVVLTEKREPVENLDVLPMPAYDLLPMQIYPYAFIYSSRGCPYKCVFCLQKMFSQRIRSHSVKRVADELEFLEKEYGFDEAYFQDQEFTFDNKRVKDICREIKKRKLKIKWSCNARFDDIEGPGLIQTMKDANCILVNFGLETASKEVIKATNKQLSLEKVLEVSKIMREVGLEFTNYLLIALPGETKDTIRESVGFLVKNDLGVGGGNIPIPYPGTPLYYMAQREGLNPSWDNVGQLAGKVGTNIIDDLGGEVALYRFVWKTYFEEKYGKYYFIHPAFIGNGVSKVFSKIISVAKKGRLRKIKKSLLGHY